MPSHRLAGLVATVILFSYAYFFGGGGSNQNARFDVLYSLIQNHSLQIDALHDNTADKAIFEGHVYCDKAPGLAFVALPLMTLSVHAMRACGITAGSCDEFALFAYIATVGVVGVAATGMAVLVFYLVLQLGGTLGAATLAALALALGSPMWSYATLFWGHALVAALFTMAVWVALAILRQPSGALSPHLYGLLGGCLGLACLTSYTALIPGLYLTALVMLDCFAPYTWGQRWRAVLACGSAAGISLALLLLHNHAIFGSPFVLGYSHTEGWEGMKTGFFGLNLPQPRIVYEVMFGPTRGLFRLAPLFLFGVFGLLPWRRRTGAQHLVARFGLFTMAYYLLMNAAYVYWNGGASFGPRHMGDGLACYALGIGALFSRSQSRLARVALVALGAVGVVTALVAVSVALPDDDTLLPWAAFIQGAIPTPQYSIFPPSMHCDTATGPLLQRFTWNLGNVVGLRGHWSLLPLYAGWLVAATACACLLVGAMAPRDRR